MLRLRFPCILCFGVALPFQQVLKALLEFGARGPCAFNVSSKERAAHDKEASISVTFLSPKMVNDKHKRRCSGPNLACYWTRICHVYRATGEKEGGGGERKEKGRRSDR